MVHMYTYSTIQERILIPRFLVTHKDWMACIVLYNVYSTIESYRWDMKSFNGWNVCQFGIQLLFLLLPFQNHPSEKKNRGLTFSRLFVTCTHLKDYKPYMFIQTKHIHLMLLVLLSSLRQAQKKGNLGLLFPTFNYCEFICFIDCCFPFTIDTLYRRKKCCKNS